MRLRAALRYAFARKKPDFRESAAKGDAEMMEYLARWLKNASQAERDGVFRQQLDEKLAVGVTVLLTTPGLEISRGARIQGMALALQQGYHPAALQILRLGLKDVQGPPLCGLFCMSIENRCNAVAAEFFNKRAKDISPHVLSFAQKLAREHGNADLEKKIERFLDASGKSAQSTRPRSVP